VAVVILYLRFYRLPLGKISDIAGLVLPLGHSIGRIGCFFAGCCYGKACQLPWAITFTHPESLAPLDIPLHPTELYHSASNFLIFLALFFIRRVKRYNGQVFWLYVLFYGITRSVIEVFRGDYRGPQVLGLFSVSQTIGMSAAAVAAVMLIICFKRAKALDQNG